MTIDLAVPYGTDVTNFVANYGLTGGVVTVNGVPQINGQTSNDFTNPVYYLVTADDGTTNTYTAAVTVAAPLNNITSFYLDGYQGYVYSGATHGGASTISVSVPYGTTLANATPSIMVSPGASVSPASGVPQDFTQPVIYTVTAADSTTQEYTVAITVEAAPKDITSFSISSGGYTYSGALHAGKIVVTIPYGQADVTQLVGDFTTRVF